MRVVLAFKNFAAYRGISHIGLGVSAHNTAKTLAHSGVKAEPWGILDWIDLRKKLNLSRSSPGPLGSPTHVIISAPWIEAKHLFGLCNMFPEVTFAMNCHSNVGFLQADRAGVEKLRAAIDLEMVTTNFRVSGNSRRFVKWIGNAYGRPCLYLPNLYYLDHEQPTRPLWSGGVLRLGSFSATRPQKNLASAVGACVEIARQLKAQTEVHLSVGREEGGGNTILQAVREMVRGVPMLSLIENPWSPWQDFRRLIGSMHLVVQPSYTESFSMVVADGIAEGVPAVVSDAIEWAPKYWKSESDDVFSIAHTGRALLTDRDAGRDGLSALKEHNRDGIEGWKGFFDDVFYKAVV